MELSGSQSAGTTSTNPWRFAGEYWDAHRGEYYLRARSFNPRRGRFTQPDPFWNIHNFQSSNSAILQASNLFVFTMNNPVRFIDPSGMVAFPAALQGSGGIFSRIVDIVNQTFAGARTSSGSSSSSSASHSSTATSAATQAITISPPAQRSNIHNWVVNDIALRFGLVPNVRINFPDSTIRWGVADLVNFETGEVWEVKRSTISKTAGLTQLARYTAPGASVHVGRFSHHRHLTAPQQLVTGGLGGTTIAENIIVRTSGTNTYTIKYWDAGNGLIQYDFTRNTDWQKVGDLAISIVLVAGVTVVVVGTKGAAAPALAPIILR